MLKRSLNEREKLITKIIAFALIVTLTIANFLLIGKETYAIFESASSEEGLIENLEIKTKSAIEKYFKIDGVGTIMQMDVNATIDGNEKLEDTAEYEIQINLPKIEQIAPKEVSIITRLEMQNIDYTKEYKEGILKINGKIDKNTRNKDFKVVCIYPEEIYISEEREINWNVIAQANNKKVYEEEYKNILSSKINSQNIAEKIRVEGIYKGIINNNEGNISTSYGEYVDIETSYLQNTSLNFIEKETKYADNEIAKTYYKKTIFSMENLKRTLGEDFEVTIKYQEEIIINKDTKTEENTDKIVITYPENTTQIEISTSQLKDNQNPIYFGNIKELITNKQEKDLNQINEMLTTYSFNNQEEKTFNIELKNPYLDADIKLGENKLELTSLEDNNVDVFVTLNADEEYKDRLMLYDNPTFKIQMPESVKIKELKDVSIQAGGNLTLNEAYLDNEGKLIVTLNGKQEDYIKDKNNAQIKINAILEVEKLINNKQGNIRCEITNKEQETVFEKYSNDINITTYSNLFTYLKVEGFNNEQAVEIYKAGTDVRKINPEEVVKKNININLQAINNLNIDLKDVVIKANATYTNKQGKETKINIVKQENTYTEEKIDLNNLTKYSNNLELRIPETLDYNEKIDIEIETIYSIDGKQNQIKQNVTLYTENKIMNTSLILVEEGEVTLQTVATLADGTVLKENDSVYAGETITYTTTIVNGTNEELKNVKVKAIVENGNIWGLKGEERTNEVAYEGVRIEYKYAELDTNEVTFDTIETLGKEPVILKHEAVVKQNVGKNIVSTIQFECDNRQKEEIKNINKIEEAELKVNIARKLTEVCDVYSTYDLDTAIRLENISNKDLKDVILKVYMKDGLQWEEDKDIYVYSENYTEELDIAEIQSYDETNKILTIKISKLQKNSIINIDCEPIVSKIPLDKEKSNVLIYVIANEKYKSNLLNKEALQSELGLAVSINSDVKPGTKLKTGDEVNITAKITNSGIMSDMISIAYELPYGLQLQDAKASDGGEIKVYNGKNISYYPKIEANGEIILQFKLKVDTIETINETCTNVITVEHNYETIKSNEIVYGLDLYYEPEWEDPNEPENPTEPEDPNKPVDPENPDTPVDPENPDKPTDPENPTDPDIPDEPEEPVKPKKKYNISGKAWLDENRNGKRDEKEKLLSGIKVRLLNSDNNSEFVKDDEGNIIEVTTKNNGTYIFENITEGRYLVVFEYDSNTYELTDYQKEGISEDINSDATIYSKEKDMGITDTINLDRNIENIDIGLRNIPVFDLKIDKYISKITTQTNKGVKVAAYENTSFAKTEIKAKEISGSTVIVEYTIKITNNGQLAGKVKNIIDNMPSDMKFNSELNTSWHMDTNKRLNYTSLADIDINPKESKEIKLILVKSMTTENTGTTINTVEIEEYSNSRELDDNNLNNNKASATVMITPATGTTTYIVLITILLGVLGVGIYLIKKNQID